MTCLRRVAECLIQMQMARRRGVRAVVPNLKAQDARACSCRLTIVATAVPGHKRRADGRDCSEGTLLSGATSTEAPVGPGTSWLAGPRRAADATIPPDHGCPSPCLAPRTAAPLAYDVVCLDRCV